MSTPLISRQLDTTVIKEIHAENKATNDKLVTLMEAVQKLADHSKDRNTLQYEVAEDLDHGDTPEDDVENLDYDKNDEEDYVDDSYKPDEGKVADKFGLVKKRLVFLGC